MFSTAKRTFRAQQENMSLDLWLPSRDLASVLEQWVFIVPGKFWLCFLVRTALLALIGFLPTPAGGALGSLEYPPAERKRLAKLWVFVSKKLVSRHNSVQERWLDLQRMWMPNEECFAANNRKRAAAAEWRSQEVGFPAEVPRRISCEERSCWS